MFSFDILINAILALVAILNPIGNLPIFVELTSHLDTPTKKKLFNLATLTGFLTLVILTFTGRWIMEHVFQIGIVEFRIAGGVLLTVLATKKIVFPRPESEEYQNSDVLELGVVPMAVPLLVGPGSIVTSILILDRDGPIIASIALVAVFAFTWLLLQTSSFLTRIVGRFGSLVLARILWIFIAAIGVNFLVSGIREAFGILL